MAQFISILRGINVSGKNKILMQDLKKLYEDLGFSNVLTYIQSGNVIASIKKKTDEIKLSVQIQQAIKNTYGFDVPVIVFYADYLQKIINDNPFVKEKNIDAEKLHVTFLQQTPAKESLKNIAAAEFPPDRFIVDDKAVYLYCPVSYGETKLSNKFFESKLKVTATTRNWKTVNALLEMIKA